MVDEATGPRAAEVVGFGECLVETRGGREDASGVFAYGGDTLTPLVAAARQGVRTAYVTQLGDDPDGHRLLAAWRAEGIDTRHVRVVAGFTGRIEIDPRGTSIPAAVGHKPFRYTRAGSAASRYGPESLADDVVAGTGWVLTSGISQAISETAAATVRRLLVLAERANTRVMYDPNYRVALATPDAARAAFVSIADGVDLLTCGFPQEARLLLGDGDAVDLAARAFEIGVDTVVFRREEAGVWACHRTGERVEVPRRRVEVVDPTGAGDAFNGGLLAGLVRGEPLGRAIERGVATASVAVSRRGTVAALPTGPEVDRMLEETTP